MAAWHGSARLGTAWHGSAPACHSRAVAGEVTAAAAAAAAKQAALGKLDFTRENTFNRKSIAIQLLSIVFNFGILKYTQ